jgi:hypothetical protein
VVEANTAPAVANFTNLPDGNYTFTVTAANGCIYNGVFTINPGPPVAVLLLFLHLLFVLVRLVVQLQLTHRVEYQDILMSGSMLVWYQLVKPLKLQPT